MAVLNLVRTFCLVATVLATSTTAQQPEATTLFQVGSGIELENIAVRSNGFILASGVGHPALYQFNPTNDTSPTEVALIPNVTSLFGIAEISPDIFAVSAGNWTRSARLVPGTFSIWTVNLRSAEPVVEKLLDLPNAAFVNGVTAIPSRRRSGTATLLMTDTVLGSVYHLDPTTLQLETLFANATANASTSTPAVPQSGINGIRFNALDQTLYYTNTILTVFCKVKLAIAYSNSGGLPSVSAAGPFSVIASRLPGDDFAVAPDGTAFIGANPVNTLYKVTPQGNVTEFVGGRNQTVVAGATSAAFGRTRLDYDALYVSTNGIPPVVNATSLGGRVVRVSLRDAVTADEGECIV